MGKPLLLTTTAIARIAATALTLAPSFGIGSRELAHNIMAGFHAKEAFNAGQQLKVRGHTGRLVGIGSVKTMIETDGGLISLPNSVLTSNEGHRALAVFVFTGDVLALEPVSLPIAALMVPVVQVALGVADAPQAFGSFSRPVVFLILAEALRKHGLTRRLSRRRAISELVITELRFISTAQSA